MKTDTFSISIVGPSGSGKTSYMTVILSELLHQSGLPFVLVPETIETEAQFNIAYRYLFELHELPESTNSQPSPMIWTVKRPLLGAIVASHRISLYDQTAGEAMCADPKDIKDHPVSHSSAAIIVLDPLMLTAHSSEAVSYLCGLFEYIRVGSSIKNARRIDIPVAVVIDKLDLILDTDAFEEDALVRRNESVMENKKVSLKDIDRVDSEIRKWLEDIGQHLLLETLGANLRNYRLFGVSNFGEAPKDRCLPEQIRPHRVLDPMLWLLDLAGII